MNSRYHDNQFERMTSEVVKLIQSVQYEITKNCTVWGIEMEDRRLPSRAQRKFPRDDSMWIPHSEGGTAHAHAPFYF
jgi:hypothetical protein